VNSSSLARAEQEVITDYEVVTATNISDLQDRVRERIRGGARPLGGIAMLHEEESGSGRLHMVFAQAMGR
jgi:hypothetical protein